MMRLRLLASVAALLGLAACNDDSLTRQFAIGQGSAPNAQSAPLTPLSVPPTMALRPNRPGVFTPQNSGGTPSDPNVGRGQDAFLQAMGSPAPSDIRQVIDENSGAVSLGPGFADYVMTWQPQPGYQPLTATAPKGWFSRLF